MTIKATPSMHEIIADALYNSASGHWSAQKCAQIKEDTAKGVETRLEFASAIIRALKEAGFVVTRPQ
jgi:hypothetical protein